MYNYLTGKVNEFVLKGNEIKSSIKNTSNLLKKRGSPQITVSSLTTAFYRFYPNDGRNRKHNLSEQEEQSVIYT